MFSQVLIGLASYVEMRVTFTHEFQLPHLAAEVFLTDLQLLFCTVGSQQMEWTISSTNCNPKIFENLSVGE